MQPLVPAFATLIVSFMYCAYDHARQANVRRRKLMHERVSELLWAVAHHAG